MDTKDRSSIYPSRTQDVERREAGEDGIRVETVIVTERNVADQVVREVEIERTHEAGRERQTTVRAAGYATLTSEAHGLIALPPEEARRYVAEAEERGLLTMERCSCGEPGTERTSNGRAWCGHPACAAHLHAGGAA